MRLLLNSSIAFSVLAWATVAANAHGQTAQSPEPAPLNAQNAAAAAEDDPMVIVITAQRREESLQKAAIAIDAVTGDSLADQGVLKAEDLTKSVPSLTVTSGGGSNTSIFIRGVGNVTNSSYNDPAVVPSYDGVVLGRAAGAFGSAFFDLARVEVLKGPQGILYGRNATGGAVNIIPNRPELGETGGGFNLSYGNFSAVTADGHINIAAGDQAAFRIAGTVQQRDGFNRDGTDDLDRQGLRAQFLYEPSDSMSVRLGGDWTKVGGKGAGGSYVGAFTPGPSGFTFTAAGFDESEGFNTTAANAYRTTQLGAPGFGFLNALNQEQTADYDYWGVNAEVSIDTAIGELTVVPAYRKGEGASYFYGPAFNTAYAEETDEQVSLEARLSGEVGSFDYIFGGFYFDETVENRGEYNQEFVLPIQRYTHETTSKAVFGQGTYRISDTFRLVGGLRYTQDDKAIDGIINNFITFCGGIPPVTPPASFAAGCAAPGALPRYPNFLTTGETVAWLRSNGFIAATSVDQPNVQVFPLLSGTGVILKTFNPVVDSGSYSRLTWKLSGEWDLTDDNLVYVTAATGYRAGGFQLAEGRSSYDPEFIDAYTIGSKNRFGSNLQLNFEGFFWKYKDQQITYFTVDSSGVLINSNENAGAAEIKGFDLDAIYRPFDNTTLTGKIQYLDSKYTDMQLITAPPRNNINCPATPTGQLLSDGVTPILSFDCTGKPLLYSPKWTLNLGVEQVVPVSSQFELVGAADAAWRDEQYGAFEYLDFELIEAYWTVDLNLTLRPVDGAWSLGAYVQNATDERHIASPQSSPIGFAVARYTAPRVYGVKLSASF